MATLTLQADAPGKGAKRPLKAFGGRQVIVGVYSFDFDASYPTGGEDISAIWSDFSDVLAIEVQNPIYGAGTGKNIRVDLANKKLLLYDNAAAPAQVANASDQSTVVGARLVVHGYGGK